MKKILVGLFFITTFTAISFAQDSKTINWLTWEEAVEASKVEKKKYFVDVYTEWCGWCKKMDASTFRNSKIVEYVNKNYYAIKFDAEQKLTSF